MKHMIEEPAIGRVLATERKLRGDRLELFQGAFDVLHDKKQGKIILKLHGDYLILDI